MLLGCCLVVAAVVALALGLDAALSVPRGLASCLPERWTISHTPDTNTARPSAASLPVVVVVVEVG